MKKKTLVLGASTNARRYANQAIVRLVQGGLDVIGIGSESGFVSGIPIYNEKIPLFEIDTVTIYLNKSNQKGYYDYILALKPSRVIFNPGAHNPELEFLLDQNKIEYERACTLTLLSLNIY